MSEKQTGGSKIKKSPGAAGQDKPAAKKAVSGSGAESGKQKPKTKPAADKASSAAPVPGRNNIKITNTAGTDKKPTVTVNSANKGVAQQAKKQQAKSRPQTENNSAAKSKPTSKPKQKPAAEEKPAEVSRRAVHTDIKEVRRNEKSIRVLKRVMAGLIVLLIGIIVYITYPKWITKLEGIFDRPARTEVNDGSTADGNFPLEPDNTVSGVYTVKNDLLTTDPHTLTFYDVNGERKASYSHNFSKPIVRTAGKRVLVFDNGAYGFKLYKKGGESYSKTVDDTILTGAVCEEGTVVIVTSSNKYAASAKFYDKDGKLIYNYDCTARIMSATLTPDGSSCYICTFYSGDGELRSQIRRIDLAKSGEQMISEEIPALALGCCVNNSGDVMAACDTAFYILGADGKLRSEYKYDGDLLSYDMSGAGAAVLLAGSTKNTGKLMIAQAGAVGSAEFRELSSESAVKLVKISDDRVILLGSDKAYSFDFMGTLTATAEIGREYSNFTYIEQALYLLGKHGIDKIKFTM